MNDILPPWPLLLAFLAASFVLAITPGPGVFYIVTRSLTQGKASGLASVAGVALGNLGNAIGASIGLAAILLVSSIAFTVVKYAGAAYLIYLGIQALRNIHRPVSIASPRAAPLRVFVDGFVVALLNPKTALFFAAFLPQFMSADSTPMAQSLVLGASFVLIAATTDTVYALAAATIAPALTHESGLRAGGRYLAGSALVGLGLLTAFSGSRGSVGR
ncbi:MAG TPA: LysE family translocator [Gammaproteobacteria bacterium]|nr:LysE family translocator [Gammaproteobacteria bacterium]